MHELQQDEDASMYDPQKYTQAAGLPQLQRCVTKLGFFRRQHMADFVIAFRLINLSRISWSRLSYFHKRLVVTFDPFFSHLPFDFVPECGIPVVVAVVVDSTENDGPINS